MRQKQDDRGAVEKAVREIKRRTRRRFSPEDKSALYCRDFAARTASRSCAAARGCTRTSIPLEQGVLEAGRKRLAGDIDQ